MVRPPGGSQPGDCRDLRPEPDQRSGAEDHLTGARAPGSALVPWGVGYKILRGSADRYYAPAGMSGWCRARGVFPPSGGGEHLSVPQRG